MWPSSDVSDSRAFPVTAPSTHFAAVDADGGTRADVGVGPQHTDRGFDTCASTAVTGAIAQQGPCELCAMI